MKKVVFTVVVVILAILSFWAQGQVKNVVIVHGAFADGSGWQKVYTILKARGYNVSIVGNPCTSMDEDVAVTKRVLDRQNGPVILVGQSYGGAIITVLGNSKNVAGLVYITAFAPDEGETMGKLLGSYPADPNSGILPAENGFVWFDPAKYRAGLCADAPEKEIGFMAASQLPLAAAAFDYVFKDIAWKTKPSWFIVGKDDRCIPPDLERSMGKRAGSKVTEIKASHFVFLSHPKEVADVIAAAAKGSAVKKSGS